ncbi:MAG: hypothetical protein HY961_12645 [Ignavibacteriae bacterium]|nr:hypothetical protein [Ignavibacteriota bacterium]
MMKTSRVSLMTLLVIGAFLTAIAQQSDFEIKERFKQMYETLKSDIDSARTAEQMAQIPNRIRGLESEFTEHSALISGAFYPKTFETMIGDLRDQYALAQEKNTTIQAQGVRIFELEGQLSNLTAELERLTAERNDLLAKLRSTTHSLAEQRELNRRLTANLQAKDRLVSAMIDSIFLPFGKNIDALSSLEKDALGQKLAKTNMVSRIADIAQDNVRFLEATTLEAKDYGVLVDQYEKFRNRWNGLRDRVNAAMAATTATGAAKGKGGKDTQSSQVNPGAQVDAALAEWRQKLDHSFWAGLMSEFTSHGVLVQPFNDAKSFSASVRAYVDSAKTSGMDTKAFVDEIWIPRIDKDWRSALESESMLGKLEYASLDKAVSQIHKERFDWKIVFYIVNVLAIVLVGWWFLTRKPRRQHVTTPTPAKPNA